VSLHGSRHLMRSGSGPVLESDAIVQAPLGELSQELLTMCSKARLVSRVCDLLGIAAEEELVLHHDHLQDHADPPYVWEL